MIGNRTLKHGVRLGLMLRCGKERTRVRRMLVWVTLGFLLTVVSSSYFIPSVMAATFTVNTTDDTVDANPGDGVCADSVGK